MLIVVLIAAIVGLSSLVAAVLTSNPVLVWVAISACAIGLVLLSVHALRARQRRDADSVATPVHLGEFDPPAADAVINDDRLVERDVVREERVLHSDTGPREQDRSYEEAIETMEHQQHYQKGPGNA